MEWMGGGGGGGRGGGGGSLLHLMPHLYLLTLTFNDISKCAPIPFSALVLTITS